MYFDNKVSVFRGKCFCVEGLWTLENADSKFRGALPIPLGHPIIFSTNCRFLYSILKVVPITQGVCFDLPIIVGRFF